MLADLAVFFSATCTIQERGTETADAVGQMIPAWPDLTGHVDIACRVAPLEASRAAGRRQLDDMTVSTTARVIVLAGCYPSITTAMRAVVASTTYTIVRILTDSEALCTELVVEKVTT
jgi:hypothetical protein